MQWIANSKWKVEYYYISCLWWFLYRFVVFQIFMMWRPLKAVIVTAASAVVVPYAVALLSNILYGWPLGSNRYRRAFNPYKVFALNYALLLQATRVKYFGLMIRWRQFYHSATKHELIRVRFFRFHVGLFSRFAFRIKFC